MKILMVTDSYWPNADGAALFERRLTLGLIERGHPTNVWAAGREFRSSDQIDGPYTIYRERAVTFWANPKYKISFWPFWHARSIIRRDRPDVLHIHNCYLMGLGAMFWARRYHIPVVATNHFMPENALLNLKLPAFLNRPADSLIWWFLVRFHNKAQVVTSPTPIAVELLQRHGLKTPARAITNGIDMAIFKPAPPTAGLRQRLGIPADKPVILYVGRVDGEKRLDLLLTALPDVLKAHEATLVIAGFGKAMSSLTAQAAKLGITGNIVFTGYLEEADKPHLYNEASIFTISSPAELQSIVTLEAMASGLPIVATDVAALKELCHNGENGYLFAEGDTDALSQHLITLLTDPALRARFGNQSRAIIAASHSTEVTFDEYINAFNEATGATS